MSILRKLIIPLAVLTGLSSSLQFAQASSLTDTAAARRAARMGQTTSTSSQTSSSRVTIPSSFSTLASEEDQRVNVIASANDAVVSVIISKDLPVIQQYYENVPFGNGMYVRVPKYVQQGTQNQVIGGGSAFFVSSNGLLMTNKHVVSDTKAQYTVLLNDGTKLPATVVKIDDQNDIALLKVARASTPFLALASSTARLGQTAIAIGNALGEFRNTVSVGVVSGLGRSVTAGTQNSDTTEVLSSVLQTDAAINPGNSGGPLLNLQGQVIGMNTAFAQSAQSIGFAIPATDLRRVLNGYSQ